MKIVLDIETVQIPKEEWAFLQGLSEERILNFNHPSDSEKNQFEKDYERTRFDGTFGKIVCLGVFILRESDTPIEAVALYGSDEKSILRKFWEKFGEFSDRWNVDTRKPPETANNGNGPGSRRIDRMLSA